MRSHLALGAVGLALTVSACGSGGSAASKTGSSNGTGSSAVSAIARSHTFVDLTNDLTSSLDDVNNTSVNGIYQVQAWDSTLLRPSGASSPTAKLPSTNDVKPFLATSYKETSKGIIFNLRRGVKSSWGHGFTAADVKWSFERACANDFVSGFYLGLANGVITTSKTGVTTCPKLVDILSPYKILVRQTGPSPYALGPFTAANLQVIDSTEAKLHATAKDPWATKWLAVNTASYGPYSVTSKDFLPGQKVVMHLNPNYWDKSSVYYTTVDENYVSDTANELLELESGSASHAGNLAYQQFNSAKTNANLDAYLLPSGNSERLSFFLKFKPWRNVKVRQAISELINRNVIASTIFQGQATVDCYPLPNTFTLPFKDPCNEKYDPTEAASLLKAAGYSRTHPLTFTLSTTEGDTGPYITSEMELVQSELNASGLVKMSINIVSNTNTYNTEDYPPHVAYEATLDAGGGSFPDAGLTEQLLSNTDIYPDEQLAVQGFHEPQMLNDVRQMLTTTSQATYIADEKDFEERYSAGYMQANIVLIPQQVITAKGIVGYQSYGQPILYYDLLHPASQ